MLVLFKLSLVWKPHNQSPGNDSPKRSRHWVLRLPLCDVQAMTDNALDLAVRESYDPTFGARPLRRWLEQHIITALSRMIVAGMQCVVAASTWHDRCLAV